MTSSIVCFPSENGCTLDCFFSNLPTFDIKVSLEFYFQPNQKTLAFKSCTILYRRSHIFKGCSNLLSQDPCNCKLIADFLSKNGIDADLKSDIVINNCVNRTFGQAKEPYSQLIGFNFEYDASDMNANVLLDHSDFGAFLCGVSNQSSILQQLDEDQRGIVTHISNSIPTGSVIYFIIDRDHLFKSKVPSVRESMRKTSLKIRQTILNIH